MTGCLFLLEVIPLRSTLEWLPRDGYNLLSLFVASNLNVQKSWVCTTHIHEDCFIFVIFFSVKV